MKRRRQRKDGEESGELVEWRTKGQREEKGTGEDEGVKKMGVLRRAKKVRK